MDGRALKFLKVADEFSRACLAIPQMTRLLSNHLSECCKQLGPDRDLLKI